MIKLCRFPWLPAAAVALELALSTWGVSAETPGVTPPPSTNTSESTSRSSARQPTSLEVARQLNEAFVQVTAKIIPSVVVIRVAHRAGHRDRGLNHPFFEMLPEDLRKRLELPLPRERQKSPAPSPDNEAPTDEEEGKPDGEDEPTPDSSAEDLTFDGEGSGVVVRKDGYIVTNRHVVDGAEKIKVQFQDGAEFDAVVHGTDRQSDLAVIKIEPGSRAMAVAHFGDSKAVRVGEFAIAIGAPLDLDYSVTFGHISAKGRSRILDDPSLDQDFLQTDANINPGNSGGPLVNLDGEVIGIITLIRGMRTGIAFAIPSNLAREITEQLIAAGRFTRAYLGVRIHGLRENQDYQDAVPGLRDGVVVFAIPPGSPAAQSDLKPGDVILAVEGRPVASPQELRNEIRSQKIGREVALEVYRFGARLQVVVRPGEWPQPAEDTAPRPVANLRKAPFTNTPSFGLTVETLSRQMAEQLNLPRNRGVLISTVERNSIAAGRGLRPGDVITELDQKPVTSVKQFNETLKQTDPAKGLVVHFLSDGTRRFEFLRARPSSR
jgi:serine protease Do